MTKNVKTDNYSKARGGWISLNNLFCAKCKSSIGDYQKDGGLLLKRLYDDRLSNSYFIWQENKVISCPNCNTPLATCLLYKKEKRSSYVLFAYAVKSKPKTFLDFCKICLNLIFEKW